MGDLLALVVKALDLAVFRYQGDGQFRVLNPLPDWYCAIYGNPDDTDIDLADATPFLDNFLIDAEPHWQTRSDAKLASGVWTEFDPDNRQLQLEAFAFTQEEHPLLVIMNLSDSFRDRHHVYQKAREIALDNEKLIRTLHQRQRLLQDMLEKRIEAHDDLEQISSLVKDNASAVLICAPDGSVQVINKALVDIYHFAEDAVSKRSMLDQWISEAEALYPEIKRVVASGGYWEGEFQSQGVDAQNKWIRLAIGPVLDEQRRVTHYICIANDISDIRRSSKELEKLTDFDVTTQLPNRHSFWRRITLSINDHLSHNRPLALFYIDLDHFKRVNESLGHHAGDFLLSTMAARLAGHVKKVDLVSHLGGDEFAVVSVIQDEENVEGIAERLLAAIQPPVTIEEMTIKLSASIGVAIFPSHGQDATTLMKHADLAMFHAKEQGRNQYQVFQPSMQTRFLDWLALDRDLEQAVEAGQFELHYQPQLCLGEDTLLRLEALIRWHHPQRGLVSPADFIPMAEESGKIHDIGRWVLHEACRQACVFRAQGRDVIMAVNISPCQARRADFIDIVEAALEQTGLPPDRLDIEITESSLLEQMESVVTMLSALRRRGVSVSIDDFGSGFSSLNYLKTLPVDNLKIDQTFVRELPDNEDSKVITASIIKMAHELRMTVIAEGVETEAQLAFLRDQGCDFVQGFLFCRPLPVADLTARLDSLVQAGQTSRPATNEGMKPC